MKAWSFITNDYYERKPSIGSELHDKDAVFDCNERRYVNKWSYNRQQRRAYHRCISGLLRAKGRLERIRFMTLTSSLLSNMIIADKKFISELVALPATNSEDNMTLLRFLLEEKHIKLDFKKLNYHFNLLVKQIEYTFGFKMQYWKVCTQEGLGVLHVVFRVIDEKMPRKRKKGTLFSKRTRGFVPHSWLSKTWEEIHGAKNVEIHELKGKKSERDIAYYVVGNYVSKQPIKRMSYSQKWVCKGFAKKWKAFLQVYGKRAVEVWDRWRVTVQFQCFSPNEIRRVATDITVSLILSKNNRRRLNTYQPNSTSL
jgi:hypothetical protein